MRISATGTDTVLQNTRQPEQGFTLIEILVVVVIIGVLLSAAVALRGDHSGQRALAAEAQRLQSLLSSARQLAVSSGLPVKWQISATGYAFQQYRPQYKDAPAPVSEITAPPGLALAALATQPAGQWQQPEQRSLGEYQSERGLHLRLLVDGQPARELILGADGLSRAFSLQLSFRQTPERALKLYSDGVSAARYQQTDTD